MRSPTPAPSDTACKTDAKAGNTDAKRRRFLLALGAGGATATAAAVAAAPGVMIVPEQAPSEPKRSGYRETAHVRDYYRTTRI